MALAYGSVHELSHQLRFLLFEIGIGLPQNSIDYFITLAHRDSLKRLQHAAATEGLITSPIASHHPDDFIEQLKTRLKNSHPESQFFQWNAYRNELNESIANEAMSLAYRQRWNTQVKSEASQYDSLWSWINHEQSALDSLLFFDQWGCTGHSYLPSFRAKPGLSRREVLQNAPEFQARISIHWSALHKSEINIAQPSFDYEQILVREFPLEYLRWQEKLTLNRLVPNEYLPLPVHPWQWRNTLQTIYAPMLDNKTLILLPHHQTLSPSLSPNIMMSGHNLRCCIKLPGVTQTGPMNHDGAVFHHINALLAKENYYKNTLFLTHNLTGIDANIQVQQKHLSVQLQQNPINILGNDQRAVPLSALFTCSPISNSPLLIEIIKASNLNPLIYLAHYCRQILLAPLHLLLKHGVALNAQQENILIIFAEHIAQGQIIRNLELNKSDSSGETNPAEPLVNAVIQFITSTLKNNIRFWINIISYEYQVTMTQLWGIVREVITILFNELAAEVGRATWNYCRYAVLDEVWQHQCLFSMQLHAHANKTIYIKQANPLMIT